MTSNTKIKHLIRVIEDKGKKGKGVGSSKPNRVAPEPPETIPRTERRRRIVPYELSEGTSPSSEVETQEPRTPTSRTPVANDSASKKEIVRMYIKRLQTTPPELWNSTSIKKLNEFADILPQRTLKSDKDVSKYLLIHRYYAVKMKEDKARLKAFVRSNTRDREFNTNKGKQFADLIFEIHNPFLSISELKLNKEFPEEVLASIPDSYTNIGNIRKFKQMVIPNNTPDNLLDEIANKISRDAIKTIQSEIRQMEIFLQRYRENKTDKAKIDYLETLNKTKDRKKNIEALRSKLPYVAPNLSINTEELAEDLRRVASNASATLKKSVSGLSESSPVAAISRTVSGISPTLTRGLSFRRSPSSPSSPTSPSETVSPTPAAGSGLKKKKSKSK